ncbi:MAG: hypothetical protein ILN61_11805 [Lachnospiraceae bacterium]|nr:hypothetical protein [Lachnospiraceae bacterium]
MVNDIWYSIKSNRIKSAYLKGFDHDDTGSITLNENENEHFIFFKPLDGVNDASAWGRFSCRLETSEEMVCYIYLFATDITYIKDENGKLISIEEMLFDPDISTYDKITFMTSNGAKRLVNCEDALLYELEGRYLYLAIEMMGYGSAFLKKLRISAVGDNFMDTFPQVYQEKGGFFHRYMSVFSSIYNDFSEQNEQLYKMLDLNTCSAELLEMYGSWFGIDLKGGFLSEDVLRQLVKEAYQLNKMKGTKKGIERVLEIILGEKPVLLENRMQNGGVFEITILIKRRLTEELRHRLVFMVDQFKPLRTKIRLIQMENEVVLDGNTYLDMNAAIPQEKKPVLDEEALYDGAFTLT